MFKNLLKSIEKMDKNELLENTKLINEFMFLMTHPGSRDGKTYFNGTAPELFNGNIGGTLIEDAEFHSSWNWLMPVVAKIGNLTANKNSRLWDNVTLGLIAVDIKLIYKAVIEYIKWYNNERNKK